jgi:hypothetical protein
VQMPSAGAPLVRGGIALAEVAGIAS